MVQCSTPSLPGVKCTAARGGSTVHGSEGRVQVPHSAVRYNRCTSARTYVARPMDQNQSSVKFLFFLPRLVTITRCQIEVSAVCLFVMAKIT